jgi:hypothetical protein
MLNVECWTFAPAKKKKAWIGKFNPSLFAKFYPAGAV